MIRSLEYEFCNWTDRYLQAIIEAQQRKIDSLLSANQKLIATLCNLKDKYTDGPSTPNVSPPASAVPESAQRNGRMDRNGRTRKDSEDAISSPHSEESFESNSSVSSLGMDQAKATEC